MAIYCVSQKKVKEFKKALSSKKITIPELIKMNTEERTNALREFTGNKAEEVNLLFEQKLVLKNKEQGIKNWLNAVGETGRYSASKKEEMAELRSEYKARQQERMFNPKEDESFLSDLVEQQLGTRITRKEAKTLFELKAISEDLKTKFDVNKAPEERTKSEQKAALEYGAAEYQSLKYENSLLEEDLGITESIEKAVNETSQQWKENKIKTIGTTLKGTIKAITDNSIAMVASFDNSFMGRQGLMTLITHPKIWGNMAINSIDTFGKTIGGKDPMAARYADVLSRPNYINGEYSKAELIPKTEEQFPTSLPSKIPYIGKVFKASENAFLGSAVESRINIYDLLKTKAIENGVEWSETNVVDNGKLINSLTARGTFGHETNAALRLFLWAPRMIKARYDFLTAHSFGTGLETDFARKEAATNLLKGVIAAALVMMIANALKPGSAEDDPTSSNFGKIKIGNTTFDYTGGAASLLVLASRLITNTKKSSTTGIKTELGSGYGVDTKFDVFVDFLAGKTTPPVSAIISAMKGRDYQGNKPTLGSSIYGSFAPIMIQNAIDLKDNSSAEAVLGVILDGFGINTQTYNYEVNWERDITKELQQFKDTIGESEFIKANKEFNNQIEDWLQSVRYNPAFSTLTDEEKQKEITSQKKEIKDSIYKKYGFKYKAEKTKTYKTQF